MTLALGILASALSGQAPASVMERLVMPGDVIKGHAKYEDECSKCHKPFSKALQRDLCLDCHEKVAEDVEKKLGYHGLSPDVKDVECRHCHTEHKGRDFNAVIMDSELFDHAVTDYELKGAHARVKCALCHKSGKKYRDAPSGCIDCHEEDDTHRGDLGKKCKECHDERSWRKASFDHDDTDFPLKDKHEDASCASCHPNERYKKTPDDCYTCHRLNDVHNRQYGKKCEECHTAKDWEKTTFDHDDTDFPLKEKHRDAHCAACHGKQKNVYEEDLKTDCYECHKNDDIHKGRYGEKCKECHTPKDWDRSIYDHDETDFPLKDKHEDVRCDACHRGPAYDSELKTDCYGCHKVNDVHRGQQGKVCEKCHNEKGWRSKVFFDHDLTRFPLIGLHSISTCEECHPSARYKDTPIGCIDCHRADDDHEGTLGTKCGPCHNPNGWALWRFDHESQTDFKLDGAHEDLNCRSCHTQKVKGEIEMSTACYGCHQKDDEHRGSFGLGCERCHNTESFEKIRIRH